MKKAKTTDSTATAANLGYEDQLWKMADKLVAEKDLGADPEDPDESEPLFRRVLVGVKETTVLRPLRDELLPKLLSGELRLKDAESFVSEVA